MRLPINLHATIGRGNSQCTIIDYFPRGIITETGGYIGHFVYCVIAIQQRGILVHRYAYHIGLTTIAQST